MVKPTYPSLFRGVLVDRKALPSLAASLNLMMTDMMKILLADDDENIRSALGLLLEQEPDVLVVGSVVNATGLHKIISSRPWRAMNGRPLQRDPDRPSAAENAQGGEGDHNLLLLDWELPGWSPSDLSDLRQSCPDLKIIALSVGPDTRQSALAAGADAFVSKSDPPDQVLDTVRRLCCQG